MPERPGRLCIGSRAFLHGALPGRIRRWAGDSAASDAPAIAAGTWPPLSGSSSQRRSCGRRDRDRFARGAAPSEALSALSQVPNLDYLGDVQQFGMVLQRSHQIAHRSSRPEASEAAPPSSGPAGRHRPAGSRGRGAMGGPLSRRLCTAWKPISPVRQCAAEAREAFGEPRGRWLRSGGTAMWGLAVPARAVFTATRHTQRGADPSRRHHPARCSTLHTLRHLSTVRLRLAVLVPVNLHALTVGGDRRLKRHGYRLDRTRRVQLPPPSSSRPRP